MLQEKQPCWENNHDDIKRITAEINENWAQEKKNWHQQSRVEWLKEGMPILPFFTTPQLLEEDRT